MALRLSKNLKSETTNPEGTGNSKGFDVSGNIGTNYDLDKIEASKSRTNSAAEIIAQLAGNKKTSSVGSVTVKKEEPKIFANNADAVKYLFKNEPSTDAYEPSVTLRRPIVIWEEGTPDKNIDGQAESLYEKLTDLEIKIKQLEKQLAEKNNITNSIEISEKGELLTDKNIIPNVNAVYELVKDKVCIFVDDKILENEDNNYSISLENSKIIDENKLDLSDSYYDFNLVDKENKYYTINFGGK